MVTRYGNLKHLSYSALSLWETDRSAYYFQYLAENRMPREPQTQPMAAGSAFDAYVKAYLSQRILGHSDLDAMFESEVERQHWDFGREAGVNLLRAYLRSGACKELLAKLEAAEAVSFESTVVREVEGVPIKGKPDLEYDEVILDWKVTGYCYVGTTSPKPGYVMCRDGWRGKQSRSHGKAHKFYRCLQDANPAWADQLATYSMIGSRNAKWGVIHQLCGPAEKIRVAEFESPITLQEVMIDRYKDCWDTIHNGQIFDDPEQATRLERAAAQILIQRAPCSTPDFTSMETFITSMTSA